MKIYNLRAEATDVSAKKEAMIVGWEDFGYDGLHMAAGAAFLLLYARALPCEPNPLHCSSPCPACAACLRPWWICCKCPNTLQNLTPLFVCMSQQEVQLNISPDASLFQCTIWSETSADCKSQPYSTVKEKVCSVHHETVCVRIMIITQNLLS